MAGLTVSPDQRWLVYVQIDQSGRDIMLVENSLSIEKVEISDVPTALALPKGLAKVNFCVTEGTPSEGGAEKKM
jgi:hypothetical protein